MNKITYLFFISFILNGCGNDKIERKARLDISFFDKYDNQVFDGVPSINFYGKKNVTNFFEYVNDANSIKQCNTRIQHILENTNSKFKISLLAQDLGLRDYGTMEELRNFRSIESMKFRCVVEYEEYTNVGDPKCILGLNEKFSRRYKPPNYKELTEKEKTEIDIRIVDEVMFWSAGPPHGLGFCQYDVIETTPGTYFIKDIITQ